MKVTAESTSETLNFEVGGVPVPARVWAGETDAGVPLKLYVTRIEPQVDPGEVGAAEKLAAFEAEFQPKPRTSIDAIVAWCGPEGSGNAAIQHRQGLDAEVVGPGDVVQLGPEMPGEVERGCFMFVTRVLNDGVAGLIAQPGLGGWLYFAAHGSYARIGRAKWTPGQ